MVSDPQVSAPALGGALGADELLQAIHHDELVLHYQPLAGPNSQEVVGVEALCRWQHPRRGLLLPQTFIAAAERHGLMTSLTNWVLRTAVSQGARWREEGLFLVVSVNLSPASLHDPALPGTVASLLDRWGVPAAWLQVEITETAMLLDPTRALETLSRLRQLGVRVALDDFGAGYSSLVRLKRLPADTLKIDRSLIADIDVDERALAIVRSTIDLGHRLGLQVVAEGVENRGTNALLQTLGCDLVQGFYLSPPLPAQSFVRWLRLIREATTRRLMAEPR